MCVYLLLFPFLRDDGIEQMVVEYQKEAHWYKSECSFGLFN